MTDSKNINILIIDDEEIVRETIKAAMEYFGHKVLVASHGKEGINLFSKSQSSIDLVILDYNMPGENGLSVLKSLKDIAPDIQVIISTGIVDNEIEKKFMEAGAAGILAKPFTLTSLEQTISKVYTSKIPPVSKIDSSKTTDHQDRISAEY